MTVEFNKFCVSRGAVEARVSYTLDNHISGKPCVTVRAKDYSITLSAVIGSDVINNSDMRTDYSEKDHIHLFEDHPLYKDARIAAEKHV